MAGFTVPQTSIQTRDVQRSWLYEFSIPEISRLNGIAGMPSTIGQPEGFTTSVRAVNIPGWTIDPIQSDYMGDQIWHPGKKVPVTDITVQFEEDGNTGAVRKLFENWGEVIQNINKEKTSTGGALPGFSHKEGGFAVTAFITTFKYDMTPLQKIKLKNLWPTSVPEVSLAADGAEKIVYDIVFKIDDYEFVF